MNQVPSIDKWCALFECGQLDIGEAMVMTLVEIGQDTSQLNYFSILTGEVGDSIKELISTFCQSPENEDVRSWLNEMSSPERVGFDKLVEQWKEAE
jgi:hypothetical protein